MSERWKPKNGESYFYFNPNSFCNVSWKRWGIQTHIDHDLYQNGNCFRTRAEAEAAAEKVKSLLLSLHDNGTSTDSETLKNTFTDYLKKCSEIQSGMILQIAREHRLSEQYHNGPEKNTLPEWVEVGGYIFDPTRGYGKIIAGSVNTCHIQFECMEASFLPEDFAGFKQARLRPYNADEMKALIGKVIEQGDDTCVVVHYSRKDGGTIFADGYTHTANELMETGYTINGKPCGKLEHLENGEWVE